MLIILNVVGCSFARSIQRVMQGRLLDARALLSRYRVFYFLIRETCIMCMTCGWLFIRAAICSLLQDYGEETTALNIVKKHIESN